MNKSLSILIIEDSPGEVVLFKSALNRIDPRCYVKVCKTNATAFEYLKCITDVKNRPNLIVIDSNCSTLSAQDVLNELNHMEQYTDTTKVIFSRELNQSIENDFTSLGADKCFLKPSTLTEYFNAVTDIYKHLKHTKKLIDSDNTSK